LHILSQDMHLRLQLKSWTRSTWKWLRHSVLHSVAEQWLFEDWGPRCLAEHWGFRLARWWQPLTISTAAIDWKNGESASWIARDVYCWKKSERCKRASSNTFTAHREIDSVNIMPYRLGELWLSEEIVRSFDVAMNSTRPRCRGNYQHPWLTTFESLWTRRVCPKPEYPPLSVCLFEEICDSTLHSRHRWVQFSEHRVPRSESRCQILAKKCYGSFASYPKSTEEHWMARKAGDTPRLFVSCAVFVHEMKWRDRHEVFSQLVTTWYRRRRWWIKANLWFVRSIFWSWRHDFNFQTSIRQASTSNAPDPWQHMPSSQQLVTRVEIEQGEFTMEYPSRYECYQVGRRNSSLITAFHSQSAPHRWKSQPWNAYSWCKKLRD